VGDIPNLRLLPGLVVAQGGDLQVNVNGTILPAALQFGYIPSAGDPVNVLVVDGRAVVLGARAPGPRPGSGTVSGSASGGRVPVSTPAGTLDCRYTGTAPSIGTLVFIDWQMSTPRLMAGDAATVPDPVDPAPVPPPPAPPPVISTGDTYVNAIDSASFQAGGNWQARGTDVYQWFYSSFKENRGAWFYGNGPLQLAGRTITRFQFRIPARLRVGDYNAALTAHFYRHTSRTRPGGDVIREDGPQNVVLASGQPPAWVDLPVAWGQHLVNNGGGFGLLGSPYLAMAGVGSDPASGQLCFSWRRSA